MTTLSRYCIACKQIYGCISDGKRQLCSECDKDDCTIKDRQSKRNTTGGICPSCHEDYKDSGWEPERRA